jgi:hypothetical protein
MGTGTSGCETGVARPRRPLGVGRVCASQIRRRDDVTRLNSKKGKEVVSRQAYKRKSASPRTRAIAKNQQVIQTRCNSPILLEPAVGIEPTTC